MLPDPTSRNGIERAAWQAKLADLPADSVHRLAGGHFTFSFAIEDFQAESLNALNDTLSRDIPAYSGWPPFTYLHGAGRRPVARGDMIEAWLADLAEQEADSSDYWRVSRDGKGFLVRPMQEDNPHFMENRNPPARPLFDWTLPIYRAAELLKFVQTLALRYAGPNAQVSVILQYYNAAPGGSCALAILDST